ncbi:MAG: hypothetical protein AAGD07_11565 [Planctomycetota bacterium]
MLSAPLRCQMTLFGLLAFAVTGTPRLMAAPPAELTLTTVTLYSAGKGVFKYEGQVDRDRDFRISVPESEVSHVMRTIGANDTNGKFTIRIATAPDPIGPVERLPETETLSDVLLAMRGQNVRIAMRGGGPVQGRLVAIELRDEVVGDLVVQRELLTLLNGDGLLSLELADVATIQAQDALFQKRLHRALDQQDSNAPPPHRDIVVAFQGDTRRKVEVVVTREVPVWKATYQATENEFGLRAVVQNTTETPWEHVRLQMIDGAPISFNVDLDRVVRLSRPDVDLAVDAPPVSPELAESITQRIARGGRVPRREELRSDAKQAPKTRGSFGGGGFGGAMGMDPFAGSEPFGNVSADDPFGMTAPSETTERLMALATSESLQPTNETYGALLIINAKDITVGARETLLMDTSLKSVEIGLVSVYRHHYHPTKPTLSLEIVQNGASRLPQGPLTVILADRGYAGEAVLPQVSPRIPRLVGFALDDGIRVTRSKAKDASVLKSLTIDMEDGKLREEITHDRTIGYLISNRGTTPRVVIIDHPRPQEPYEVVIPDERKVEASPTSVRFQCELVEDESTELSVEESYTRQSEHSFGSISLEQLRAWIRNDTIDEANVRILKAVYEERKELEKLNQERSRTLQAIETLAAEISRVTQQLKVPDNVSLPTVLVERYQDRLIRLEDERDAAIEESESMAAKIKTLHFKLRMEAPDANDSMTQKSAVPRKSNRQQQVFPKLPDDPFGG